MRDRQKGKSQKEGLPPRKRLEIYRKEYYRMMKKEHAAHGADVGLPMQDYRYMDNLKEKVKKLEAEIGETDDYSGTPIKVAEKQLREWKEKVKRWEKETSKLNEESETYHVQEVRTIDPETYRCPYKKFDPRQHKNAMEYNRETNRYELKKPSNFRY